MRSQFFYRWFWLSLSFSLASTSLIAQDPLFTQYFSNPLTVNPAFSGVNEGVRINTQFRTNWVNWPLPYKTAQISFENYSPVFNSGFGLRLLTDDAGNGVLRTHQIAAVYAYQLRVNKEWFIRFGLEAGANQVQLNWSKLYFEDQIDPFKGLNTSLSVTENSPSVLSRMELDLGTGILIFRDNGYVGISLKHLNRFNQTFLIPVFLKRGDL